MIDYKEVHIHKLSPTQNRKLLKGEKVRIRLYTSNDPHHIIRVSPEQHKKLHRAHKHQKAYTIQFDPYQCEQHGEGIFGNIKKAINKHKHLLNPIIRAVKGTAHQGLNKLSKFGHEKIDTIPEFEGNGIVGDVLGGLSTGANYLGFGVKHKKKRTKRGKGFLTDIAKAGAKAVATKVIDAGANYATNKINGMGRRTKKCHTAGALQPAGF